ncbi:MAG: hypothetical protein RL662_2019 [Bacteroidota bacterium]
MDSLKIKFVFNRKNTANNTTQKGALEVYVYDRISRKKLYLTTGIDLHLNQFVNKQGEVGVIRNHHNATAITGKAHKLFREVEAFCLSDKCNSIEDVREWDKDESFTTSIVEFIRAELKRRDPSYSVVEYNNSFIKRLGEHGKIKTFEDVTYENLLDLDAHLRKKINSQPTLYKRHVLFKGYIREAMKRGLCKSNPYDLFKLSKGKEKQKEYLTEEEVQKILKHKPRTDKLQKTKDLFIFQCYTGLAYIDVMNFDASSVTVEDGVQVIRSSRTKTDESYIVPLYAEAEMVAEWYGYNLPKISNQKYNDYIKIIAEAVGITKNLTSHIARHTFATTVTLANNISIESVSKMLGHKDIKMTQHYAKVLESTVNREMAELSGKLDYIY